jgi:ankyrin repeat protein
VQVEVQVKPTELDIYAQLEEYLGAEEPNAIEEINERLNPSNEIVMRAFFCSFNRRDTVTLKALLKAGADIETSPLRAENTVGDVNPPAMPPLYIEDWRLNESPLRNGPTAALMLAIVQYDIEYVKLLIEFGADVNAEYNQENDQPKSPLWFAFGIDSVQQTDKLEFLMAKLLLKNGADATEELRAIA